MLIVLRGRPTLRSPDGTRQLREGDVVTFPRGPEGAKAITNETDEVARVVIVSTNTDPDVAEYPDTGKVGIWIGERGRFFHAADAVEHAGPEGELPRTSLEARTPRRVLSTVTGESPLIDVAPEGSLRLAFPPVEAGKQRGGINKCVELSQIDRPGIGAP